MSNTTYIRNGALHRSARTVAAKPALSAAETALLIVVLFVLVGAALFSWRPLPADVATKTVRVQAGETLWSIAAAHPVPGLETAETADLLQHINRLESSQIAAGANLLVPSTQPADELAMR